MGWTRSLATGAALTCALWSQLPALALEPHRAGYRLTLADQPGGSPLLEVQGGLVIEWQQACDGWLSRQRLGFVAATEEGGGFSQDVSFSSWEALDGSRLRYSVRSYESGEIQEEYRGEAWVKNGTGGIATFREPEEQKVALPAGTIFPTRHLEMLLAGAVRGERIVSHEVFDGWGYDALTQITAAIGNPRLLKPIADDSAGDDERRAWPVSMAYFNIEQGEEVPEFEASFLLVENGVLRDLTLDYGDFRLSASLERFEHLMAPDC